MAEKVQNTVKEVASEEAHKIKALTAQAARSGAYLYPIKGIAYFLTHRPLWRPLLRKLAPTLTLGTSVTAFMFVFTYVPQAAVMAFTSGPLAALSAALLVLSESSTITTAIARSFIIQDALLDMFDGTLVSRETTSLVSSGRQIQRAGADPMSRLGKIVKKPFASYTPKALIRYLLYLPLNFIPVVGSVVFVILQGRRTGPERHDRYFQLKEWNRQQRERHVEELKGAYTGFGVAATLLELVPVAGIFFSFTNTVGAALWAADLERGAMQEEKVTAGSSSGTNTTAPGLRDKANKAQ